jgi:hypothetical protein
MDKLYENIFKNSSEMDIKLTIGNRNRRSATHELIRKRPNKVLLQNKPIKSEYFQTTNKYFQFYLA